MSIETPSRAATHDVVNQSVPFEDVDLLALDAALAEGLRREGGAWAEPRVSEAGRTAREKLSPR